MKRICLCLLLVLLLSLSLLTPALAWDANDDWYDAYAAFVLDGGYRKDREYSVNAEWPVRFTLYALDGDLCPELLLRDPLRAMAQEPYDVFTWRGGAVTYIGRLGIRGGALHYAPGLGRDGVFSYDGSLGYYTAWYYTMRDGSVESQRVMESVGETLPRKDTWTTSDETLRAAFRMAYDGPVTAYSDQGALPACSVEEIRGMGWETFALGSSGTAKFYDVPMTAWFAPAAGWAAEQGVASGTAAGYFTPDGACTRAQMVTFLWRAAGKPEATQQTAFRDVSAGAYYAQAVAWAVESGVTQGTAPGVFSPNTAVTRAQAVTFLHRAAGLPDAAGETFTDVPANAWFAEAVSWASAAGVTRGTGGGRFSPNQACTRDQIVTFLYRAALAVPGETVRGILTARHLAVGEPARATHTYRDDAQESLALITFTQAASDVRLYRADVSTGTARVTGEPRLSLGDVKAGDTLLIATMFPDVGPHIALRYTANGKTETVGIAESGRDGSLVLIPIA